MFYCTLASLFLAFSLSSTHLTQQESERERKKKIHHSPRSLSMLLVSSLTQVYACTKKKGKISKYYLLQRNCSSLVSMHGTREKTDEDEEREWEHYFMHALHITAFSPFSILMQTREQLRREPFRYIWARTKSRSSLTRKSFHTQCTKQGNGEKEKKLKFFPSVGWSSKWLLYCTYWQNYCTTWHSVKHYFSSGCAPCPQTNVGVK